MSTPVIDLQPRRSAFREEEEEVGCGGGALGTGGGGLGIISIVGVVAAVDKRPPGDKSAASFTSPFR